MDKALQSRIVDALRQISAHDLQVLAEEMACVRFPNRFMTSTLVRAGRNAESQTTKGWPDAYVITGKELVDGIEATRDKQNWEGHLANDVKKAVDPAHPNLSGYFFVGGYPSTSPAPETIRNWTTRIAEASSIDHRKVHIFIGDDLVQELMQERYARIRQHLLGIAAAPTCFHMLGPNPVEDPRLGLFQPSKEEFEQGLVAPPAVLNDVMADLATFGYSHVRGYGAAGKTTLAQLVARTPTYRQLPSWYLDIAPLESEISLLALTELVDFSGEGVLFVIDNVHIDEGIATRVFHHWEKFGRSLGSKLLLLGRLTNNRSGRLGTASTRILRAGFEEMISVTKRLSVRHGMPVPEVSPQTLEDWAQIFGGNRDARKTAVDLIAFTAALELQINRISRGDFRLKPEDAVEAVRFRYLRPLRETGELDNLLRLAALAEYEIGLSDAMLVSGLEGFERCKNQLGIVIEELIGLERRREYKLVHAALGTLLLRATPGFDVTSSRAAVARESPSTGLRMIAGGESNIGLLEEIRQSVVTGKWVRQAANLYEAGNIVRRALQVPAGQGEPWAVPSVLDVHLVTDGVLRRLLGQSRDLIAINTFVALAGKRNLSKSLDVVQDLALAPLSSLSQLIVNSRAIEVVTLVRGLPLGIEILKRIEPEAWVQAQRRLAPDTAANTVSAAKYLEEAGRSDLASEPCRRLLRCKEAGLWRHCDLSHLSQAIRLAAMKDDEIEECLSFMARERWIELAALKGGLGHMCGALLSFANHLPVRARAIVLTSALEQRVRTAVEDTPACDTEEASRLICLYGAFSAMGGGLGEIPPPPWWGLHSITDLLREVVPVTDLGFLGMYELEFWLGLMAFELSGLSIGEIHRSDLNRAVEKLAATVPPTVNASVIKEKLLVWCTRCLVE